MFQLRSLKLKDDYSDNSLKIRYTYLHTVQLGSTGEKCRVLHFRLHGIQFFSGPTELYLQNEHRKSTIIFKRT